MIFLPVSLTVGGRGIPIDADFRNILTIYEAFEDDTLTDKEKAFVCLNRLYREQIPPQAIQDALERAYWFCGGGDLPKSEPTREKTLDWVQDAGILFPAVSKAIGFEVRSCPFLHWWSFLGAIGEIGEGLFTTVMHIRSKRARGKKLEKWEQEFYRRNKALIDLRSDKDRAAIAATEDFLKDLI